MSSLQVGRLLIGPAGSWQEAVGDPITSVGGQPIPAPRQALRHQVSILTWAADGASDLVADRLRIRRQLRSMLNNSPLKLAGGYYVIYSDDPEQNGWYLPDFGQLSDIQDSAGLATGLWKLENVAWTKAGHRRTNREARNIRMKNVLPGTFYRDILKEVYSTNFIALTSLQIPITYLPAGATGVLNSVNGQVCVPTAIGAGRDGGQALVISGLVDLTTLAYERPESSLGLSDVVCYDRRGQITAPATGPDTSWEEVYGPDYPWNWLTFGQAQDTPVLDNGYVRVRWDGTNTPGFRVDYWNGSAYVEQGKLLVFRAGDVSGNCDTFVSAGLYLDNGYTSDRAVIQVVMRNSADAYSNERVFITLQRGWRSIKAEVYAAPLANGSAATAQLSWYTTYNTSNHAVTKMDGLFNTAAFASTAGHGSLLWSSSFTLGASSFPGENWVNLHFSSGNAAGNSDDGGTAHVFVPVKTNHNFTAWANDNAAYGGGNINHYALSGDAAGGYAGWYIFFPPQGSLYPNYSQSVLDGYTNHSGVKSSTASFVADATSVTGTQTLKETATSPPSLTGFGAGTGSVAWNGLYNVAGSEIRIFVRCKVDSGVTGSITPGVSRTLGTIEASFNSVAITNTAWAWVDIGTGSLTPNFDNESWLYISAWAVTGAGAVYVDDVHVICMRDEARAAPLYMGTRDCGGSTLYDSRTTGALVAR